MIKRVGWASRPSLGTEKRARHRSVQFGHSPSPEGRTENSPRPSGLGTTYKENRPERGGRLRGVTPKENVRQKLVDGVSEAYYTFYAQSRFGRPRKAVLPEYRCRKAPAWRAGDAFRAILFGSVPRPEGLGCSVFALRAIKLSKRQRRARRPSHSFVRSKLRFKAWSENGGKCETSAEAHLENGIAERHSVGKPKPPKLRTRNKGRFSPRFPWQYSTEKVFPRRYLARGSSTSERQLHYSAPPKARPHLLL